MQAIIHSMPVRCAAAFLAVAAVAALKILLGPLVEEDSSFLLFFVSLMLSSWFGGFGPGLAATVLSAAVSDYYFHTPGKMITANPFKENFQLGLFLVEGTLISWGIATLKRTNEALKEADRRKDDFMAMLAHELRNPLTTIFTAAELLRLTGPVKSELRETSDLIDRAVRRMIRLVDDLLDVSRIIRGKAKLLKQPVEAASIVSSIEETARSSITERNQKLTVSLPPEPVWLEADPVRLTQILTNLVNNAAKYTDEGGEIALTVEHEGGVVAFHVRDTGIGIPAAMLTRIFDQFTQVDGSADRCQGGLGIGLALVRRLAEMHGGKVEAFSAGPGQGSEFVVRLPIMLDRMMPRRDAAETSRSV